MWHTRAHFLWQAFIHVLGELQKITLGDKADMAWDVVDECFRHHPEFVNSNKKPLHAAVGSLCLKAYGAREKALRQATNGILPRDIPDYIQLLRDQQSTRLARGVPAPTQSPFGAAVESGVQQSATGRSPNATNVPKSFDHPAQIFQPNVQQPQVPLPTYEQPDQSHPLVGGNDSMYASDSMMANDLDMADMPMDWAEWDKLIADFNMQQS
jgi:hypothetical protein